MKERVVHEGRADGVEHEYERNHGRIDEGLDEGAVRRGGCDHGLLHEACARAYDEANINRHR